MQRSLRRASARRLTLLHYQVSETILTAILDDCASPPGEKTPYPIKVHDRLHPVDLWIEFGLFSAREDGISVWAKIKQTDRQTD